MFGIDASNARVLDAEVLLYAIGYPLIEFLFWKLGAIHKVRLGLCIIAVLLSLFLFNGDIVKGAIPAVLILYSRKFWYD